MTIRDILNTTEHRPWAMPDGDWKFYQEWNRAIFLHWPVEAGDLRKLVPGELEIDLLDGTAWVSLVAFTMENIRPRFLPAFPPISTFDEINIRTYVRSGHKSGVYFLSIEGGKKLSCTLAKTISELPYRFSAIRRDQHTYNSSNVGFDDRLNIEFHPGKVRSEKSPQDLWLTERYALFQDTNTHINGFDIHHLEWPVRDIDINRLDLHYPRFSSLLKGAPALAHYSDGVQVLAWGRDRKPKTGSMLANN
jgi:uncharacterized protein YqjF (DUF2071 family)